LHNDNNMKIKVKVIAVKKFKMKVIILDYAAIKRMEVKWNALL